ncbi:MAG: hypothetical protein EGQ31_05735 [Prevotella sp.]|nr:hypothetical protein [Prevotella sp.]
MENNNNFSEQTLNLLRPMLDIDTLEVQIQLLDDVMDDYLDVSPDIMSNEEAAHRLDVASNLRRMSKNLKDLKKINRIMTQEEDEKMQLEYIEAYFDNRNPVPEMNITGQVNVPEPKSTTEIIDDLSDMYDISKGLLSKYLVDHGYSLVPTEDGRLKWMIYRYYDSHIE